MKETKFWLIIKYFLTLFLAILIPVYWHYYGPLNFLWLSDMGLFLTTLGLWFHMPVMISMAVVGVMAMELIWCVDYFSELFSGVNLIALSDYMFDPAYPLFLRGLSLFHVVMPVIWILYLVQYGYDKRALWYMTILYWIIMIYTYTLTNPIANVNWVYLSTIQPLMGIPSNVWLILLMILFPLCVFVPLQYVCTKLFKKA